MYSIGLLQNIRMQFFIIIRYVVSGIHVEWVVPVIYTLTVCHKHCIRCLESQAFLVSSRSQGARSVTLLGLWCSTGRHVRAGRGLSYPVLMCPKLCFPRAKNYLPLRASPLPTSSHGTLLIYACKSDLML